MNKNRHRIANMDVKALCKLADKISSGQQPELSQLVKDAIRNKIAYCGDLLNREGMWDDQRKHTERDIQDLRRKLSLF